jgi:hypothetical protein
VFVVLAVLVTPVLQPWLAQQHEIASRKAELEQLKTKAAALQAEKERWNAPEFVKTQARKRLHLVEPGQVGLVEIDDAGTKAAPDPRVVAAQVAGRMAQGGAAAGVQTWYATIWESARLAGGAS